MIILKTLLGIIIAGIASMILFFLFYLIGRVVEIVVYGDPNDYTYDGIEEFMNTVLVGVNTILLLFCVLALGYGVQYLIFK